VDPERHRPGLAASLHDLGDVLCDLNRPADAAAATEEAVAIRRDLAAADPDRYRPRLAESLAHLGELLGQLGRSAEALAATEEAVAIRRVSTPTREKPEPLVGIMARRVHVMCRRLLPEGIWLHQIAG
jgi:tetratricopeptide (TPR) repeat protein